MADGLFGAVPITGLLVNSVLRRGGTPGDASRSRRRARFTYSAFVALLFNAAVVACIVAAVAKHDRSFVGLAIVLARSRSSPTPDWSR
jgi:hypothetical protein